MSDLPDLLPLGAIDFHVLLVLSEEDLYGYAIKKAVERNSEGRVSPEIGSLYRVLARLQGAGLLGEAPPPPDAPDSHRGRPRRYYRITPRGRAAVRAETERLDRILSLARGILPDAGP